MRMAILALFALPIPGWADDGKVLAPFLDDRAFAVLRLELRKIDVPKLLDRLAGDGKRKPAHFVLMAKEWSAAVEGLVKDGSNVAYVVASLADVPDEFPFLVLPLGEGADAAKLTKRLAVLKQLDPTFGVSRFGSSLVAGSAVVLKRLKTVKPAPRVNLIDGLGKAAPPARLVIGRTSDARRILEEVIREVPAELGGGSIQPLSRGLQWVCVDLETAPRLLVRLTAECRDSGMARALDELVSRVLRALAKNKDLIAAVPELAKLPTLWKPERDQGRLVVTLNEEKLTEMLRPYVEQALLNSQLRRLAEAMIAHSDEHGTFPPPASYDKSGKPLLSWRVHLLPLLGDEALYKEFKLDEPWDGPHNKKLIARMPRVYAPLFGAPKDPFSTHYQVVTGPNTPFPPGQRQGPTLATFRDGLRNTLLIVEAAEAVPWTKPSDLVVDPKKPLPRMGAVPGAPFFGAMADGTLRRFRHDFDERTMRWVIDPADGQGVDFSKVAP